MPSTFLATNLCIPCFFFLIQPLILFQVSAHIREAYDVSHGAESNPSTSSHSSSLPVAPLTIVGSPKRPRESPEPDGEGTKKNPSPKRLRFLVDPVTLSSKAKDAAATSTHPFDKGKGKPIVIPLDEDDADDEEEDIPLQTVR